MSQSYFTIFTRVPANLLEAEDATRAMRNAPEPKPKVPPATEPENPIHQERRVTIH